jgi:hypothetical protein
LPKLPLAFFSTSPETTTLQERNNSIITLVETGDLVNAREILKSLEKAADEVYPNAAAYNAVLSACLRILANSPDDDPDSFVKAIDQATELIFNSEKDVYFHVNQYNSVLEAWSRIPQVKGAPQRAQRILQVMQQRMVAPTIDSYNHVLETWANSREYLRGTCAELLFQQIEVPKNGHTYRIMIDAWVKSHERFDFVHATKFLNQRLHALKKFQVKPHDDWVPTVETYHSILEAQYRKVDLKGGVKAMKLLETLEEAYIQRISEVRADLKLYRWILRIVSQSNEPTTSGPYVDRLMQKIWERHMVPDTVCFEAAITTYTNCARHPLSTKPEYFAGRSLQLLEEMKKTVFKSDTVVVSTAAYNGVLRAFAAVDSHHQIAYQLLKEMEEQGGVAAPNANTYTYVVQALANSFPYPHKIEKAQEMMQRAQQQVYLGNESAKPTISLYNALLQACASSRGPSEPTFRNALQILREIEEEDGVEADSKTFHWLLEACHHLLEDNPIRYRAIEQLFNRACYLGVVDQTLLSMVGRLIPSEFFSRVVSSKADRDEDGTLLIPVRWTRKTQSTTFQALTINGRSYQRRNVADVRMTKLRSHENRNLLQGGRQKRTMGTMALLS